MDSLFELSSEEWSLRKEGRREHLPMSLPSLECSSAAHLVWADIRAGAGRMRNPHEPLIPGSQAGVMEQTGSLLKKWSLWNDRSLLHLRQRAGVKGWRKLEAAIVCLFEAFLWFFERQIFEGTRSWCKHTVSVVVAAVRDGAEDDRLRGKCLLAFTTISFPTLLTFS